MKTLLPRVQSGDPDHAYGPRAYGHLYPIGALIGTGEGFGPRTWNAGYGDGDGYGVGYGWGPISGNGTGAGTGGRQCPRLSYLVNVFEDQECSSR